MKKNSILLFIIMVSCVSSNKKNSFIEYLHTENIKLNNNSLYLFLPNTACSFCVNSTIKYLKNSKSNKINVILLESDILSMINKKAIKELELNNIYYSKEDIADTFFNINNKKEFHSVIFTVEYLDDEIKYHTFESDEIEILIKLLMKYE